ncbi:hypothetical protein CVT24_003969 [Panaeolus cyanescens]|uniref:Glutathione hydrolase n=1 Tax=Panaeolus cyanescens TaxID=181874 RepID=A0A409Y6H7_9AGAR|nr:hypothetical protein CVT24_003969 [Panaeolus cyanescens]
MFKHKLPPPPPLLPEPNDHRKQTRTSHTKLRPSTGIQPSTQRNPAFLIKANNGAVAAENHRCSQIGVDTLKEGGNAVDAAIAATFCTGVVNMFSSGIGGGGFMTIRIPPANSSASSQAFTIDFRETAPALSNTTMFKDNPHASQIGGLSVGVPGEVRGLSEAHKRWGSLPWSRLVQPSIDLARGWHVDRELGKRIPWYPDLMLNNPDWSSIFAPFGRFLKEGELIRRTNLSRTLDIISREGPDAFYEGPIADSIVRKVQATGGILTHQDMKDYKVIVKPALQGTYRGRKIYTSHAPTSGPVLLHMLNLLEHYPMEERTGLNTHRLLEAMKFGFAARYDAMVICFVSHDLILTFGRTKISDPEFGNQTKLIDEISTKEFAARILTNLTDDSTHLPDYYQPVYDVKTDHGTSHTSVIDKSGMAVAVTSTVNLIFGSQVLDPETGIILNDEMDDFSTPGFPNAFGLWPSPYNYPEPGKRPLSSTAPTIIEHPNGEIYLAIGGSGGSRIFGSIFQVLINLEWGMDISSAIEYGRLHNQLYPLITDADDVYPLSIIDELQQRGHNITISDVNRVAAVIQAVLYDQTSIYAASDSRKNGIAAGY